MTEKKKDPKSLYWLPPIAFVKRVGELEKRVDGLYNTSYTMAQILQAVSGFEGRLEKVEALHKSQPPVDHRAKTKYVWVNTWWEGGKWYITEHESYDSAKKYTEPPFANSPSARKYINVATKAAVPVYWDGS